MTAMYKMLKVVLEFEETVLMEVRHGCEGCGGDGAADDKVGGEE